VLNLDPAKLLIIAVVAVILLGPDKLPQVARQAGAAWRTFNDFRHRMENEVRNSIPDLPSSTDIARLARSPSALLNHLSNMAPDGADEDEEAAGVAAAEGAEGAAATSAEHPGAESPAERTVVDESANGSLNGSANGAAHGSDNGSGNGSAAGLPPMTSVPPTSTPTSSPTPSRTPAVSRPSEVAPPVDPSLN
jgi:sec-independent protein translocase protein TatB